MSNVTPKSAATWVLTILLAFVFVAAGGAKLAGVDQVLLPFERLGTPQMAKVVGFLEIAGAIGLFIPKLRLPALAGLAATMIGAIGYHLTLDPEKAALPGIVLLILCITLFFLRRPTAET